MPRFHSSTCTLHAKVLGEALSPYRPLGFFPKIQEPSPSDNPTFTVLCGILSPHPSPQIIIAQNVFSQNGSPLKYQSDITLPQVVAVRTRGHHKPQPHSNVYA